jgi:endonuclease/exonuclease/phosphatase family metal-dependent hydrolase
MRFSLRVFCALLAGAVAVHARPFMVLVYNVENLHDADGVAQFEDYQPARYSKAHVLTKLNNIAKVLGQFEGGRGPDVILFQEIEVDFTPGKTAPNYEQILATYAGVKIEDMLGTKFTAEVGDLPAEALLLKTLADRGLTGYRVAVPDVITAAGTDRKLEQKCVVFTRFPIKQVKAHATENARAILEVQIDVDGAPLYLFDNHWKSGAGDAETEKTRVANARTLRTRLNEIFKADPNADVLLGGDFNSQYNQSRRYAKTMKETGLNDVLGSQGNELAVRGTTRDLYNLWYEVPAEQRGSDTFRGEWGTLMQMMISRGLYDYRGVQYVDNSFGVAKIPGLNADAKGLPVRWSGDGPAGAGFSDHFPIYAKFVTVTDGRSDRYLPLRNASAETATVEPVKIDYAKIDVEKTALKAAQIPADTSIRSDAYKGKLFRVEGVVAKPKRLGVEFLGETYDVWSYDEALRNKLREEHKAGDTLRFYGELNQYRERWQFVIHDASWVK